MRHQIDHRQPVPFPQRGGDIGVVTLAQRGQFDLGTLAQRHGGQRAVPQRHHPAAQPVVTARRVLHQVAQLAQRIGQAGDGGLGQAGAGGKGLVGEIDLVAAETAQQAEPARQCGDELGVAFIAVTLGQRGVSHGDARAVRGGRAGGKSEGSSLLWFRNDVSLARIPSAPPYCNRPSPAEPRGWMVMFSRPTQPPQ